VVVTAIHIYACLFACFNVSNISLGFFVFFSLSLRCLIELWLDKKPWQYFSWFYDVSISYLTCFFSHLFNKRKDDEGYHHVSIQILLVHTYTHRHIENTKKCWVSLSLLFFFFAHIYCLWHGKNARAQCLFASISWFPWDLLKVTITFIFLTKISHYPVC
jgi:hypothetical protein